MQPRNAFTVIILAAGIGRRLGREKATLPWGSTTLLEHILNQFPESLTNRRIVILNSKNRRLVNHQLSLNNELIVNPQTGADMLSSVRCGISQLGGFFGPLCIHPVDVFGITPEFISLLHDQWQNRPDCIHLPEFEGKGGHPLIIPPKMISEIDVIPPGNGLSWLLKQHPEKVVRHAWPNELILRDIDTPEDYLRHRP